MLLSLYRALGTLAWPLIKPRIRPRHEVGFDERCGRYSAEKLATLRGAGPSVWIHAVSVGEVQAASPIIWASRGDGFGGRLVVSTVTETGARNAALLAGGMIDAHIYAPWDIPAIVRRAADAVAPSVYVSMETEIWPARLGELRRRGIPRLLVNARVSDRSWARRGRLGFFMREGYRLFDKILTRGPEDERRLLELGAGRARVELIGDTKIDAILARREAAVGEARETARRLGAHINAPLFVAGSTHDGEDELVLAAFGNIAAREPSARLVIAPRHPERAGAVLALAGRYARAALFSDEAARRDASVVVVDVIGVLYALYGAAWAVFIGGSAVPKGGQNILEPASWGAPTAHGPHMEDFAEATAGLDACGLSAGIRSADELASFWLSRARPPFKKDLEILPEYFQKNAGASAKIWAAIKEMIHS